MKNLPLEHQPGPTESEDTTVLGLETGLDLQGQVSIDLNNVTVNQALEATLRPFDLSFVIEAGTDDSKLISLSLYDTPVRDALRAIGSAAGVEFRIDGGVVRVSQTGREAVAVVPPLFGGAKTATAIAEGVGEGLDVSVIEGHVVVAGTRADVKRFTDVSNELRGRPPGQWSVTVWIIAMDDSSELGAGVRGSPGLTASVLWGDNAFEALYSAFFSIEGTAFANSTDAQLLTKSSVVLVEGRSAEVGSTTETPIPKRSVSPQGTVQVLGYEYISTGLIVSLAGRPIDNGLEVDITPELSSVSGFVGDTPIVSKRSTTCTCLVRDGAVLVLSGMEELLDSTSYDSPLFFGQKTRGGRIVVVATFQEVGY